MNRALTAAILLFVPAASAFFADEAMSPATALRLAITELTREAQDAERSGEITHRRADFAARFDQAATINAEVAARKLLSPVHHDDFIDGYVRWQLTSFLPGPEQGSLPETTRREFERLMERLPPLPINPRADESLVVRFRDASQAGPLNDRDRARLEEAINELAERSSRAEALALPALGLRDWFAVRFKSDAARSLHLLLERCAAMVRAGWSVRDLKAELDDAFATAERDREVDQDDRAALIAHAAQLTQNRRMFIESASIIEGTLVLTLAEAAVYDFDVVRWTRMLAD